MTALPPRPPADYEKAKDIARNGDSKAREALATREDIQPELLYFLAEDAEPAVRRAIAANVATPAHADLILAKDTDDDVRQGLAGKIAALAPGLDGPAYGRLHELTRGSIQVLARDELPRVRAMMSEALADLAGSVPDELRDIVHALAADEVLEVAAPVLERSALLGDDDLLRIIEAGPAAGALGVVARRDGLGGAVTDMIAARGDNETVAALLANDSAQIREETLDAILDRAPDIETWHEPLVNRPHLSAEASVRIAGFVAGSLVDVLCSRADLDPATAEALREAVADRIGSDVPPAAEANDQSAVPDAGEGLGEDEDAEEEDPADEARRLHSEGALNAELIMEAIAAGKRRFATSSLAALAEMSYEAARDVIATRSAKTVTALCWKAGLEMRDAIQIQIRLAGISPQAALYARDGTDYPLSVEDMEWQLEFFGGG